MAARKVVSKTTVKKVTKAPKKAVARTVDEVPIKRITERTVRNLEGVSLLTLQSKKRINGLFVVNMHKDNNVLIDIGSTSVMVPDTWMPYDLSTHAEPHSFLQSPSFRSLISSTATRGPLLKVVDSKVATYILNHPDSDHERSRLRDLREATKPSTRSAATRTVSQELKDFMTRLNNGEIKPRSAGALLGNIVKNEAERAYVLKNSTYQSVNSAVRALRLGSEGASVRGSK